MFLIWKMCETCIKKLTKIINSKNKFIIEINKIKKKKNYSTNQIKLIARI